MSEEEHERRRLRQERDRLIRQIAKLVEDGTSAEHSATPLELEQHHHKVKRHRQEFQTFRADLEEFRRVYGPLGDDDQTRRHARLTRLRPPRREARTKRNEREHRVTQAAVDRLREAIAQFDPSSPAESGRPQLGDTELDCIRAQITNLEQDLAEYVDSQNGVRKSPGADVTKLRGELKDLGTLLIYARTMRGWSQGDLAERLRMDQQKIEDFEAKAYGSVSLVTLREIAQTLGLKSDIALELIEIPDRDISKGD